MGEISIEAGEIEVGLWEPKVLAEIQACFCN